MRDGGKAKAYGTRTDLEKITSNWNKIRGLFRRKEWSSAVVRAATACEIAANLAIREELQVERHLSPAFVDSLLKWANGIQGKLDRLILPATEGHKRHDAFKDLKPQVAFINSERNAIAHGGAFKNKKEASAIIENARCVVLAIVSLYVKDFHLYEVR
jgi:hypothetical protein